MKTLALTSPEAIDALVAVVVRLKIKHTAATAEMEAEVAAVQKRHTPRVSSLADEIAGCEKDLLAYCTAHRAQMFPEKKSRETPTAVFGFELTPPRVETSSKKLKWKDVIARLQRLPWGSAYVRQPEPKPDKEALLADREKLTPEQLTAAGIAFEQDEQFFIRPKSESAEATTQPA